MPTIDYRWDYAKIVVLHPAGQFQAYYRTISEAGLRFCKTQLDWDKSHKVQAFHSMEPLWERTCVEVWGEASELVKLLPWNPYHEFVKRLDVRAILWEVEQDAVMETGERLNRHVSSLNVETFNSKAASKRLGRDRGGRGFRLGSRKSDVCVVVYKRNSEPAAQEFRFQGQALANAVNAVDESLGTKSDTLDLFLALQNDLVRRGERRLERGLNEAGIGTYWPLFDHKQRIDYEGLQRSFATYMALENAHEHYEGHWPGELEERQEALMNGDVDTSE